ncbi:MAG: oxidoreductase [Gemmatimonadota bacterium]|nr:oxidoreductase [Gemmatimonadota bacterium]MDH3367406.1 oxidoreductase [Gemmatimonadota bacterium]MDH3479665.1 oxidoreductase [Gemmatimonadota bacterium]MDH3570732.1 oxidoreductase [Gemmatimonadota bacterium]MDH5550358.1 oxidoreductase [Gemmatimonadota bacterium]
MRLKDYDTTRQMRASVVSSTRITPDNSETELRHIDLAVDSIDFDYQVGQSIGVLVPGPHEFGLKEYLRLYSIAGGRTADDFKPVISLLVKRCYYIDDFNGERYDGKASNYLCDLKQGDTVTLVGPYNIAFALPKEKDANLLMIGLGTGIAPFRAFIKHIYSDLGGWEGDVRLYHGAMTGIELAYMNDQNADLKYYYDEETFKAFQALSPRAHFDVPVDLEGAMAENADEVWTLLQDPKTHVYVAGLKQISGLLDEALVKIIGSPETYEQQKAKMIDEGRWAELIY